MKIWRSNRKIGVTNPRKFGRWGAWIAICGLVLASLVLVSIPISSHPGLAVLAGVVVGAAVTAAVTWIVGPSVDRQIRAASRREESYGRILEQLVSTGRTLVRDATDCMYSDTGKGKAALEDLQVLREEVWIQGVLSGDRELRGKIDEWSAGVIDADLAWKYLPEVLPDENGMVNVRIGGPVTDDERVANDSLKELRALTDGVLEIVGRRLSVPTEQRIGARVERFRTPASQKFSMEVAETMFRSFLEQPDVRQNIGARTLAAYEETFGDTPESGGRSNPSVFDKLITSEVPDGVPPGNEALGYWILRELLKENEVLSDRDPQSKDLVQRLVHSGAAAVRGLMSDAAAAERDSEGPPLT